MAWKITVPSLSSGFAFRFLGYEEKKQLMIHIHIYMYVCICIYVLSFTIKRELIEKKVEICVAALDIREVKALMGMLFGSMSCR